MIRRPPRSPLFPYTTLSRSHPLRLAPGQRPGPAHCAVRAHLPDLGRRAGADPQVIRRQRQAVQPAVAQAVTRSEEHTSELQSQSNLVCRLLLEKKKNNENTI